MIWYRQVLHVAAKDLRHAKKMLALYYAFIGFELVVGAGLVGGTGTIVTFLGIPLTMYVVSLIVQGDSAVRADAFWVTRPVSASAVILAKVVAVVVGMMIPAALAELLFFEWLGMSAREVASAIIPALVNHSVLLVIAMLVAAVTSNGRSFLTGLIILLVVSSMIASVGQSHHGRILLPPTAFYVLDGLALLSCAFAIIDVYRTRNRRQGRLAGVTAFALVLGPSLIWTPAPSPTASSVVIQATSAQMNTMTSSGIGTQWIELRFSIPRLAADRPVLSDAEAYIERADGHRELIEMNKTELKLHDPAIVNDSATRWLSGELVVHDSSVAQIALTVTGDQVAKVAERGARLVIIGTMNLERTHVETTLPLVHGAVGLGRGIRYQFDSVVSSRNPQFEIRASTVEPLSDAFEGPRSAIALVNPAHHEAVRMGMGSSGGPGVSLPLFNEVYLSHTRLVTKPEFSVREGEDLVDAEWLRGAHLEFLRWTAVRSYPVEIVIDSKLIAQPPR